MYHLFFCYAPHTCYTVDFYLEYCNRLYGNGQTDFSRLGYCANPTNSAQEKEREKEVLKIYLPWIDWCHTAMAGNIGVGQFVTDVCKCCPIEPGQQQAPASWSGARRRRRVSMRGEGGKNFLARCENIETVVIYSRRKKKKRNCMCVQQSRGSIRFAAPLH